MGLVIGAAALGAAGSIAGGILSSNAAKSQAKKAAAGQRQALEADAAERERLSQMIQASQDLNEQRTLANEQAAMTVYGALGSPGSYNAPSQYGGPLTSMAPMGLNGLNTAAGVLTDPSNQVTKTGMVTGADVSMGGAGKYKGTKSWSVSANIADPNNLAAAVMNTSSFRTVSRMVADAEGIMNETGPAWNQLQNSVIGSIYASSATANRQALEAAQSMIARKGGAARTGMNWVTAMRTQDAINNNRANLLFNGKMSLLNAKFTIAMQAQNFALAWTKNQFGFRDTLTDTLNKNQNFWSQTWPVAAAGMNQSDTAMLANSIGMRRDALIQASNTKIGGAVLGLTGLTQAIAGVGSDRLAAAQNYNLDREFGADAYNRPTDWSKLDENGMVL